MVAETDRCRVWLRRYVGSDGERCPAMEGQYSYHDARVQIEDHPQLKTPEGYYASIEIGPFIGDPRWPTHCACGREFREDETWQVLSHALYTREDGQESWTIRDMPPGAMFDTFWLPKTWVGPDGRSLSVALPPDEGPDRMNHIWHVDGPSSSGGRWTRTGEPPVLTVTPSILTHRYHGFLTSGVLTDSLPDRPL